jgi:cytochrome c biogenesis protein CcdA
MAGKGKDKNYVSIWFWLFAFLVVALPCIGPVMIIFWAFSGENESRKNYFRAFIVLFLIFTGIWGSLIMLGIWPELILQLKHDVQQWSNQRKH